MITSVKQEKFFPRESFPYIWVSELPDGGVSVKVRCPAPLEIGGICDEPVQVKIHPHAVQSGDEVTGICHSGKHFEVFQLTARAVLSDPLPLDENLEVFGTLFPQ